MKKTLLLSSLCLILSTNAQAEDIKFVASFGYDAGGDTLGKFLMSDGSTKDITAGDGGAFAAGAYVPIESDIGVQATIGYKFDSINTSSGTVEFTRMPLDVLVLKDFENVHSIGAGVTYHMSPEYTCQASPVCNFNVTADNAFGFIAEYSYSIEKNKKSGGHIGVRYTNISYNFPPSFDGSSIGLLYTYR